MSQSRAFATRVVHAGRSVDAVTGAVAAPIQLSTTFARDEGGELLGSHVYARTQNPNREALEQCLAELEGGAAAACFASGSAAANALLQALSVGDRVVVARDLYHGFHKLAAAVGPRAGLEMVAVDASDLGAVEAALARPTQLLLCESPTNPMLRIVDLAAVGERARRAGACFVVDGTWATPVLQQPLALGADLVLHSTTKYLAGHSDVTGGALVVADRAHPLWARVCEVQALAGAVPSPFDCWLTLRSIATLAVRVNAQVERAEVLAERLAAHPAVERVLYPGLASHPGVEIARRQMRRPGAMLSVLVRGGEEGARRMVGRLGLFVRATSLGGVHSLAEHRAPVEGPTSTTPRNLVRLSIGLEDPADLWADLAQALAG